MTGELTIAAGELLEGSGTINGELINSGTINAGNSPGVLTVNNLINEGVLEFEIGDSIEGQFDVLQYTDSMTLDGTLRLLAYGGFDPMSLALGDYFELIRFVGSGDGSLTIKDFSGPLHVFSRPLQRFEEVQYQASPAA